MSTPQVLYWRGKDVREMSKDELIEALIWAAERISTYQSPQAIRARALGSVEMIKRGEIINNLIGEKTAG
jgi:hypothetical protein